jgi:hypothetical protein
LARDGGVDAAGELQQRICKVNTRCRELSDRLSARLQSSRDASTLIQHWQVGIPIHFYTKWRNNYIRSLMQALCDRLLVWFSHREVQLQQAENVSSDLEAPWEILNLLHEELEQLECPRNEIRDLARNLIDQQILRACNAIWTTTFGLKRT